MAALNATIDATALLGEMLPLVLAVLVPVVVLWSGVLFWAVKWLLARYQTSLEERFTQIAADIAKTASNQQETEKQILKLKTELAKEYVRREDWIRGWSTVEAKLDAMYTKIDEIKEWVYGRN